MNPYNTHRAPIFRMHGATTYVVAALILAAYPDTLTLEQ